MEHFIADHMTVGAQGEDLACAHLEAKGWTIMARNWRSGSGEVDIVALTPEQTIVLVEVKTRCGEGYGSPLEAITYAKLAKLREMAARWFAEQGSTGGGVRIDAVAVTLGQAAPVVCHVQGIA